VDGGFEPIPVRLPYRGPMAGGALLEFLARRAVAGIEQLTERGYRRSLRLAGGAGVVELEPGEGHFSARYWLEDPRDLDEGVRRSRMLLDLDADPRAVQAALGHDRLLGPLVQSTPGLRVPRHVDADELAVRAVLGQQISVAGAATVAGRLVSQYGERLRAPCDRVTHLFPSVRMLDSAEPERLPMPRARARALTALAGALARRELVLDPAGDRDVARRGLLALPGIGPWTAGYVAMRGLGDSDVFLASDLGVRRALERLGADRSPRAAANLAERWRPYRAYAFQHLLAVTMGA
jgi:AraC family transcriptional regulator, regulatory protein of adaptative response / DNA-3-methyladenine glycosylase II